jgi:hypothetical protein
VGGPGGGGGRASVWAGVGKGERNDLNII